MVKLVIQIFRISLLLQKPQTIKMCHLEAGFCDLLQVCLFLIGGRLRWTTSTPVHALFMIVEQVPRTRRGHNTRASGICCLPIDQIIEARNILPPQAYAASHQCLTWSTPNHTVTANSWSEAGYHSHEAASDAKEDTYCITFDAIFRSASTHTTAV